MWRPGQGPWLTPREVPEIASLLSELPPPLDDDDSAARFQVAQGSDRLGEKTVAEIVALIVAGASLKVWQKGWPSWRPAADVEVIGAALSTEPPALDDDGPPPLDDEPPPL